MRRSGFISLSDIARLDGEAVVLGEVQVFWVKDRGLSG